MPDIPLFAQGLALGFSIAAPVGPIGVLCIRRTLAQGRLVGLVTGLGAATADALYGSIAAFGLTFLTSLLVSQQFWLRLVGGAFLCYLGIRTALAQRAETPDTVASEPKGNGLLAAYGSTFFLTVTNPLTIIFFAGMFAGIGALGGQRNYASPILLVLGVFAGSAFWWFLLSGGVGLFRSRLNMRGLVWLNWVSGGIILVLGLLALATIIGERF